jgi:hypothetical protein
MAITVWPNTGGEDHIAFTHDERSYIVYFALGPELKRLAAGAAPDPAIVDESPFVPGDMRLHVTSVVPGSSDGEYVVYVDGIPSELTLTKGEVATLAGAMPTGR